MEYRLSPSDLTFLYDACKHCFVLKVKHKINQPSIPLPGVFSTISNLQKDHYSGKRTGDFCPHLPPGVITLGEQRVRSAPVSFAGLESTCSLAGRFDIVAAFDNGSYGVLDFKTGNPSEEKTVMYGRQLHAYALALENPAPGALRLQPVSRMGLLYFTPDACSYEGNSRQVLAGRMTWLEVEKDERSFREFLRGVIVLLDGDLPPPRPEDCDWCRYRLNTREFTVRSGPPSSGPEPPGIFGGEVPGCPQCAGPMRKRNGQFGEFWGCLGFPGCRGTRPA